ncbi:unnamed protein product [Porites evermanni]|uniref:BTB domain-containing protein n=1 Tax=Porites evermanni TaxID=104178 RepID=A0ABN8LS11_9CNID|nr:unnamed protein product [Porites evermanni]
MFTSEFKEKNKDEIPLPGKKAREIQTLLLMMYPSVEEKQVTKANCYFLFELAHEYQIESIARKCEALMASMVKKRMEYDVLAMLVYGQKYELKTLISTCIYEARRLTLMQLKRHRRRLEIEPDNYMQIAEGIIQRLETQCKEVREGSLKNLERVSESLCLHVESKSRGWSGDLKTTNERLDYVLSDSDKNHVKCTCLSLKSFSLVQIIVQLPPVRNSLDRLKFNSGTVVLSMTWFQTSHYNQLVNNIYIRIHFKSWLNRLITMDVSVTVYNFLVSIHYGMTQDFASAFPTDFLEPWKLSDVVLVVEDQKFHVHRGILAFWSPVFEKMFTSEFKEKNKDEIPLPGKKAREIQTLLLMMYPSVEEKQVTRANCYFLFELAHEYQIESIARKCEVQMALWSKNEWRMMFLLCSSMDKSTS